MEFDSQNKKFNDNLSLGSLIDFTRGKLPRGPLHRLVRDIDHNRRSLSLKKGDLSDNEIQARNKHESKPNTELSD